MDRSMDHCCQCEALIVVLSGVVVGVVLQQSNMNRNIMWGGREI